MSSLEVLDKTGAAVGQVELDDSVLVQDRGEQAVHEVVVNIMANRRAGTASTLSKGEVAGSNRKPWRQKGTGRARAGYRQSPVWRGGGVAFGPHPRDYGGKINRKVARLAFRRALSDRIAAGGLKIVESLALDEAKTRQFAALMKALSVSSPALFVDETVEDATARSARNLPGVELANAKDVNVFQLLRYPTVVATRAGFEVLKRRLEPAGKAVAEAAE